MTDRQKDSDRNPASNGQGTDLAAAGPSDDRILCSSCPRIGRPCPAALCAVAELDRAGQAAGAAAPDFEMTGLTRLTGCGQTCPAVFQLSAEGVALYCGIEAGADMAALARFASGFVTGGAGLQLCPPVEIPLAIALSGPARPAPATTRPC